MNVRKQGMSAALFASVLLCGARSMAQDAAVPVAPTATQPVAQPAPATEMASEGAWTAWQTEKKLYVEFDAVWLLRSFADRTTELAVRDTITGDTQTVATTNGYRFQYEPGLRVLFGKTLTDDRRLELSYFGLNNWFQEQAATAFLGPDDIAFSPILSGLEVDGNLIAFYNSMFHNVELNVRKAVRADQDRAWSVLFGFRYLNLTETLSLDDNATIETAVGDVFIDESRFQTNNNVIAFQVGFLGTEEFGPLSLSVFGTGGISGNFAKAGVGHFFVESDTLNLLGANRHDDDYSARFSGLFTLGARAAFFLNPHMTFRCGYEFLLIPGMAFAPEQTVTFVTTPGSLTTLPTLTTNVNIEQDGFLFLHGFSVGLELIW